MPADAIADLRVALAPPERAIASVLQRLARAGKMREVSVWTLDDRGGPHCAGSVGDPPTEGVRRLAGRALAGSETPAGGRRQLVAIVLRPPGGPRGALAARVPPGTSDAALELLSTAAPVLEVVLDRRASLEARQGQTAVMLAAERRLTRLGLDLHDGPAQEVAALLSDVRLFAGQLAAELHEHPLAPILTGRVADLEHHARALEGDIRELARATGGPAAVEGSVVPALRAEVRAFGHATGIASALEIGGPVDESTPSQRITLMRGVQEALRNAREHSGAETVAVTVSAPPGGLEATITDDGKGFDVERAFARAKRRGRLGLGGVVERARLLGGRCEIESSRGGPTCVRIALPRWKPGEEAPDSR